MSDVFPLIANSLHITFFRMYWIGLYKGIRPKVLIWFLHEELTWILAIRYALSLYSCKRLVSAQDSTRSNPHTRIILQIHSGSFSF